jgi:rod shape determining protein RodA
VVQAVPVRRDLPRLHERGVRRAGADHLGQARAVPAEATSWCSSTPRSIARGGLPRAQSQIAIGSGGLFGRGFTQGPQKRLAFLPAQHTDFIFAVVGEELGFIGVLLAFTLFLLLFLRVTKIAERANDSFSSLVAFGLLSGWFVHVLVNVGMTLNLMPITGIPLPFFSYGGSFMLASWLAIGVLVRISAEGRGGRTGPFAV